MKHQDPPIPDSEATRRGRLQIRDALRRAAA
jgi:hypothetical protein